jgi:OOP family OmpA-OmpF porin
MKIFYTLFAVVAIAFSGLAQDSHKMFLEYNVGLRLGKMKSSENFRISSTDICAGMGFRYMFNDVVGIRVDGSYDAISNKDTLNDEMSRSTMLRGSVQGVVSVSQLANFDSDRFSLLFHGGFGATTLYNADFKSQNPDYDDQKFFKKQDDMINLIFGLTPQIHVNESITIGADISYVTLLLQDKTADFRGSTEKSVGGYMNATLGITFGF